MQGGNVILEKIKIKLNKKTIIAIVLIFAIGVITVLYEKVNNNQVNVTSTDLANSEFRKL